MLRCILWGTGKRFFEHINLIKYYELQGDVQVIGVTSKERPVLSSVLGYSWKTKRK